MKAPRVSRFSVAQTKDFWSEQARTHASSPSASWSDHRVIDMEIRELLARLPKKGRVLDVGCANGWTTLRLAQGRPALRFRGLDYIPEMIAEAGKSLAAAAPALRRRVEFAVGDATALPEKNAAYDALVMVRVLINLHDWERQVRALEECARVLKPGGLLFLSEATVDGWKRLNGLRAEWSLPPIPMPDFNLYVEQARVIEAVAPKLELLDIVDFASTYYVGTRLLKPLMAKALGLPESVAARPDMEWNRWFSLLPPGGDYGTQKLFVFRRKRSARQ